MTRDGPAARDRSRWRGARRAQARRVLDRRARPLCQARRRGRGGAAADRRRAVVERCASPAICSRANAGRLRSPASSALPRRCCSPDRGALVRGWIDGVRAAHRPAAWASARYFRSAKAALRKLHRAGICHNDLAKEQNWLRGADGRAYLTDFQLAVRFSPPRPAVPHRRLRGPAPPAQAQAPLCAGGAHAGRAARAGAQERDHPRVDGDRQAGLLLDDARPARFSDREGGGPRLVHDAPRIAARLKTHPQVRDAVMVAFPDRRAGTGLYAFVEAPGLASARCATSSPPSSASTARAPERLQVVDGAAAPRLGRGAQRNPAARRHEPARLDRPADRREAERATGRPHRRRPPQPARPHVSVSSRISARGGAPRARSAIAAAMARSRSARTDRSRAAPCARGWDAPARPAAARA